MRNANEKILVTFVVIFLVVLFMIINQFSLDNSNQISKEFNLSEDESFMNSDKIIVADLKNEEDNMQNNLNLGDTVLTANMIESETTREFLSMLPRKMTLYDYYSRIKYLYFSQPLSTNASKQIIYEVGDIAYWPEGNELLIYYRHDGKPMRSDIVVMGKINSGIEVFEDYSGSVEITFQAKENESKK